MLVVCRDDSAWIVTTSRRLLVTITETKLLNMKMNMHCLVRNTNAIVLSVVNIVTFGLNEFFLVSVT